MATLAAAGEATGARLEGLVESASTFRGPRSAAARPLVDGVAR
jgi:hypothetical protein